MSVSPAPGAPATFIHSVTASSESHGPRLILTWRRPQQENGIFRSYNLFFSHNEDSSRVQTETFGPNTFSCSVDVLGGVIYQFYVRSVTIRPGTNASLTVAIPEHGKPFFIFFYIKGKVTTQWCIQVILYSFLVKHKLKAKTSFTNFHSDGLKRKGRYCGYTRIW